MSSPYLDRDGLEYFYLKLRSVINTKADNALATTSANGLMSATDKAKLDNIGSGANQYALPVASSSMLGGIKVGTNLSIDSNGVLSVTDTIYSPATTSNNGLMSSSDKAKLDTLPTNATLASTYAKKSDITTLFSFKGSVASQSNLPTASASTLGHVYNVTDTGMNYVGIQDGSTYKWDAFGSAFSITDITDAQIDDIIDEYPMNTTLGSNVEAMTTSDVNAILT